MHLFGMMRRVADVMGSHVEVCCIFIKSTWFKRARFVVMRNCYELNHEEAVSAQPLEVQMTEGRAFCSESLSLVCCSL